jgi:hypothetical protein
MKTHLRLTCTIAFAVALLHQLALAQAQARIIRPAGGGNVNLPWQGTDSQGNQWSIYQGGWCQMQGNSPVYSQGAMLLVNGSPPNARTNTAKMDEKTGELLFENLNVNGVPITRRVLLDKENACLRYIEVFKNTQNNEQVVNVQIQSNTNFGIDAGQNIQDPRRKDNVIGFTSINHQGKAMVEMYAGKGSKIPASVMYQQGNNQVTASLQVTVPAGKEVAIMHLHGIVPSTEAAVQFVSNLKEGRLLSSLPPELKKIIVNFTPGQGFIGERELLRGELFDVVEIRGGDQMRGTIKEQTYKLSTFYGPVELPANRVVGVMNVGEFRPRQLVVTTDGQIFGGKLAKETLDLELTTGQTTQVPFSQITRAGYRKRNDEPEEWTFDKPFVSLRSGERVGVQMPTVPIEIVTRYGVLKLDPNTIATIVFQTEEHGVHEIFLTDGSKFAGLASAAQFEMKLRGSDAGTQPAEQPAPAQSEQVVRFPASAISRIQLAGAPAEVDEESSPTVALMNGDMLVGGLSGDLKLDTAFDTLTLAGGQVRKLTRGKESATDVQVTLWDQSIVSGQLQEPALNCTLESGVTVSVPVALLDEYSQPQPQPAANMIEKIKASVAQLNSDDWKQRDKAEAELTAMGPVVVSTLKQMRTSQPPEAQQRIDQILANVAAKKDKP